MAGLKKGGVNGGGVAIIAMIRVATAYGWRGFFFLMRFSDSTNAPYVRRARVQK